MITESLALMMLEKKYVTAEYCIQTDYGDTSWRGLRTLPD